MENPQKKRPETQPKQPNNKSARWLPWLACLLIVGTFFGFGIKHLTQFETADEHYWFYNDGAGNGPSSRIHEFWKAMRKQHWDETQVNDKPGITLAYVSAIGEYLSRDISDRIINNKLPKLYDPEKTERLNFLFRLPIVVWNALLGFLFFWALRRLFEKERHLPVLSLGLIYLSPILIGVSQIVNPDATLWSAGFGTILFFFLFLKERYLWQALASGIFLGLTLLSKYSATILLPFLGVAGILWILNEAREGRFKPENLASFSLGYLLTLITGALVFGFGMPAALVDPEILWEGTIGFSMMRSFMPPALVLFIILWIYGRWERRERVETVVRNFSRLLPAIRIIVPSALLLTVLFVLFLWITDLPIFKEAVHLSFDLGKNTVFDHTPLWIRYLAEFRPVIFSLTPFVLLGYILALIGIIRNKITNNRSVIILLISVFHLTFVAAVLSQGLLVTIRYSIILYPLLGLAAAIAWEDMLSRYIKNLRLKSVLVAALIIIQVFSIFSILPYYFNYTSFLLPEKFTITDAWGYGGYEAAQYINSLPEAENLVVWADYSGTCAFLKARCVERNVFEKWYLKNHILPDYIVLSRRGSLLTSKILSMVIAEYDPAPAWELNIDGRKGNYVKILKKR